MSTRLGQFTTCDHRRAASQGHATNGRRSLKRQGPNFTARRNVHEVEDSREVSSKETPAKGLAFRGGSMSELDYPVAYGVQVKVIGATQPGGSSSSIVISPVGQQINSNAWRLLTVGV